MWFSNILTTNINVPGESYFRNALWALNYISTFVFTTAPVVCRGAHILCMLLVLIRIKTTYNWRAPGVTPVFGGVRVAQHFSFLCCVLLFCLSSSCVLCQMVLVSLDCSFSIATSAFLSIYIYNTNDK